MSPRWRLVCAVLMPSLLGVAVHAQDGKTRVLLTSSSGGVAKGSYQGGVDWTITEYLRRQLDARFRSRLALKDTFVLGSATGASAGNINALMITTSWCTSAVRSDSSTAPTTFIAPENSLFWSTWVNTGFSQMLREGYYRKPAEHEPSVLDRTFFETEHKAVLERFLRGATPRAGCDVPMGVTMTRLVPVQVRLTKNGGSANVQRFAAVLNVKTLGSAETARIDYQAPPQRVANAASLGALALLPDLSDTVLKSFDNRFKSVFDVVLASSSFPVAFAPRPIRYTPGGLKPIDLRVEPTWALFNDGGLFDNNPFGLAVGLFERSAVSSPVDSVSVAYSNPNRYRGILDSVRRPTKGQEEYYGTGAIVQMVKGAFPSAREYELQSLARRLSRDQEMIEDGTQLPSAAATTLFLSSRSSPIMGEQIGSFGAFLGRPFREYDFYTGIYDGLEFVARWFKCGDSTDEAQDRCTVTWHKKLVDEDLFDLGDVARLVVSWQRVLEYGSSNNIAPASSLARLDQWRLTLLTVVHGEMARLRTHPLRVPCKRRNDPIASRLCPSGVDEMFERLSNNRSFITAAEALRDWCNSPEHQDAKRRGECTSDDDFVSLVKTPRRHLHTLVLRALMHLEDAEDAIKSANGEVPEYSAYVEALFSQYTASSSRYRRGIRGYRIDLNPSSAVWDGRGVSRTLGSLLGIAAPNYANLVGVGRSSAVPAALSAGRGRETAITAGWHPMVIRMWEGQSLSSTAELSRYTDLTAGTQREWDFAFGAGLNTTAWSIPGFSSTEIGALWSHHLLSLETKPVSKRFPIYHITGRLFAEKINFTARWADGRGWSTSVGLGDLNGLLYWWTR